MYKSDNTVTIRMTDIVKPFVMTFLPLAIFFGSLTVAFYYKDAHTENVSVQKSEVYKINSQMKVISSKLRSIVTDLRFLALQSELTEYIQQGGNEEQLKNLAGELLTFSKIKQIYDQIQFIDEKGLEVVQINQTGGLPVIIPGSQLASQAQQPYFSETMKLQASNFFISSYDLSENSLSEEPVRPAIRFSMPVVDSKGQQHGIVVLGYPVSHLVEELQTAAINSPSLTLLINPNGFYLNNPVIQVGNSTDFFNRNIAKTLPTEWQTIREKDAGQIESEVGLITYSTFYPLQLEGGNIRQPNYLWKAVSFIPEQKLKEWPEKIRGRIMLLYTVCLIIIAISSLMLAKTSVRRRKAEKAMRENEEELRAINEAAANAIIAIDNNKNIMHWNPAAERLFQYNAQEVVDKPITSIISPPKHQSTFTKISRRFIMPESDSREAKTIELYGYKKDGTEFPVEVSFSAFKRDGQWHTVGIIRDISARKEMEREVLKANKFESLGVLSSGIAHDFNNLLTAIIGNVNLVCKLSGTPPDSLELLKNAEKAARRAKALTQQLLTFSKDGMPIRKTTAIDTLLKDSVEYVLHGSTITCTFDIPTDLLLVDIDAAQIGQVIQNIITNSRQAIAGSGAIDIKCRNINGSEIIKNNNNQFTGNYIEIVFRDTGHGIPPKVQEKIFDPYFTTKDHGTGIGLTIALSIIQRHDGHITINSAEDFGTSVTVYLPAAVDQHLPKEQEKTEGKGKRFKILVVDDEEMLLSIAGRMLSHLGHECVCARSAREALDVYKHLWKTGSPVDGVIVDLTLPGGMGGKETAAAIFDINSEARILVASGFSNDPVMVDFDEYGFCAAIAKPFDMDELEEVIESVLN